LPAGSSERAAAEAVVERLRLAYARAYDTGDAPDDDLMATVAEFLGRRPAEFGREGAGGGV
jgi:hypothetical protein